MTALRPTLRQPDVTRTRLLECAFEEIHQRGFRSASLDSILLKAGVTKGALYHHFSNKAALGYAVVDELLRPLMEHYWLPLAEAQDPIASAIAGIKKRRDRLKANLLAYGCPFNNLAQEMSPIDEGFRTRLQGILDDWRHTLAAALERGKENGTVRTDVNTPAAAIFIISALEGVIGMGKASQSSVLYEQGLRGLVEYLERLRPD
ncbi:MAG: TetR/AcrR family transcriptional regulator [Stagnimonas sp.]|nr:TetR/AcrR family transcriptional regulator [Stagnimonas sp.]